MSSSLSLAVETLFHGMPFDTTKTGIPFYDMMLKNPAYFLKNKGLKGNIVYMSPDEYIALAAKCLGTTPERFARVVDEKFIRRYANSMWMGTKFDMPVIECYRGYTEGRHRALAAKKIGVTKIPVFVVEKAEGMAKESTYQPTYPSFVREAVPKTVFKRVGKLEINPLLVQAFGITPDEIMETIRLAEEPEAMKDMFAFLSDYATLSDPRTRSAITDEMLDFLVADLKRRMGRVAEFYREQAIEYSKLGRFMEHVKVRKLQMADSLQRISEEARKLSAFSGQTRTDKVAFIDAVVGLEHTSGSIIPIAFGISDYGREDYWPRKLLAFLRTHGMPRMVKEGMAMETLTPEREPWQMTQQEYVQKHAPNFKRFLIENKAEGTAGEKFYIWSDTLGEWIIRWSRTKPTYSLYLNTKLISDPRTLEDAVKIRLALVHKSMVQRALMEGKPVPVEVLAEYPGMAGAPVAVREAPAPAPDRGEPKINWKLNIREGRIVYMPPEEYMERINIFNRIGMSRVIEEEQRAIGRGYRGIGYYPPLSEQSYRSILEGIRAGNQIDIPNIVYRNGMVENHEGFHRALVARDIGIDKIPVQVIGEMPSSFSRALNLRWNENLTEQAKAINALKGKIMGGVPMIREAIAPVPSPAKLWEISTKRVCESTEKEPWKRDYEQTEAFLRHSEVRTVEGAKAFREGIKALYPLLIKMPEKEANELRKKILDTDNLAFETLSAGISKTSEPIDKEFKANPSLINKSAAYAAHIGTSFEPEKRGEQAISGFAQEVQAVYERLKPHARTDAEKALLINEMERFQTSYAQKYNDLLYSHSRIYSTMIAGPSGFPTERMRKINEAYDNKARETYEWKDRAEKAMLRALKGLATEEAGGEVAVIKAKIAQAEKLQEMMVEANKIIRKKPEPGIGGVSKQQQLVNLGFTERQAIEALKPDYMGRTGFPSFALTNNSANIRRMKERLIELEKREVTPTAEIPFAGGHIVDNREADRVQIIFDQKPAQEVINKLRSEGWHWSPANMAWQRKRTDYAMMSARRITGAAQPPAPAVQPIAAPPVTAPHPQAVPELRWVYGTLSGKWHLVGPEDRDYAHGITQERMKIIGQEAAKAEYLSPALARAAAPAQQVSAVPEKGKLDNVIAFMEQYMRGRMTYEDFVAGLKGYYLPQSGYQINNHLDAERLSADLKKAGYNTLSELWNDTSRKLRMRMYVPPERPPMLYPAPEVTPLRPAEEIMFVPNPETLTKEEFIKEKYKRMAQVLRQQGKNAIAERIEKGARDPDRTLKYETSHRDQVVLALAQGKPVTPLVLKDYPDIVARIRKENEAIIAKERAERERIKAIERAEENELNAELNRLPPPLKRHAETEIYGTLHLPETHKDYRNRFYIALGKVRRIAFELSGGKGQQPPVQPQVLLLPYTVPKKKEVPEPTGYFSLRKAQELIRENNSKLSDEQLHKKSIQLRDYIRFIEIPDEYSRKTLVKGGYYAGVIDQYVTGMVPVDPFLHQNLKSTLDEVYKEQQRRKLEKEKISVPTVPIAKPVYGKFVQTTFQVQERMRRYGYA